MFSHRRDDGNLLARVNTKLLFRVCAMHTTAPCVCVCVCCIIYALGHVHRTRETCLVYMSGECIYQQTDGQTVKRTRARVYKERWWISAGLGRLTQWHDGIHHRPPPTELQINTIIPIHWCTHFLVVFRHFECHVDNIVFSSTTIPMGGGGAA